MSTPSFTAQHRTNLAGRIKVRVLEALHRSVQLAAEKNAEIEARHAEDDEEKPERVEAVSLFSAALTEVLEAELKAPKGTVDRALQMTQVLTTLQVLVAESSLHRKGLGLILEQSIHREIKQTDDAKETADALGVELSALLRP